MNGKLYVVSTPIGNMEDITFRAIKILNIVDIIACEDTRTTGKLLNHYKIKKTLRSYHEHNERSAANSLLKNLNQGLNVALVTDSGTPLISDPGYNLIKLSIENDIDIIPIPGPSAMVTALSISGLSVKDFVFLGFLPRTNNKISELLNNLKDYAHTIVFYESPKRIIKTLELILNNLGDRNIMLGRELTKLHEEKIRGTVSIVLDNLKVRKSIKGEFTIIIEGNTTSEISEKSIELTLINLKDQGKSLKESVQITKTLLNLSRSKIYKVALKLWQ